MNMVWNSKQIKMYEDAYNYFLLNKNNSIDEDNKYETLNHIYNLNIIYNDIMSPEFSSIYNNTNYNDIKWSIIDYFIKILKGSYTASLRQIKIDSLFNE